MLVYAFGHSLLTVAHENICCFVIKSEIGMEAGTLIT